MQNQEFMHNEQLKKEKEEQDQIKAQELEAKQALEEELEQQYEAEFEAEKDKKAAKKDEKKEDKKVDELAQESQEQQEKLSVQTAEILANFWTTTLNK